MTQESSAGDVLQVPPWPCLHQLYLPARTIGQQAELQEEQHLQLRHPFLQDTVQTDVVLPKDNSGLEWTAPGGCDGRVTGLLQVQTGLLPAVTATTPYTPPPPSPRPPHPPLSPAGLAGPLLTP